MPQIIVVGSGIAGLMTIKTLRRNGCNMPITLLSPKLELFYYPALIWLPAGIYQERDLIFDLEWFIRRYQINYVAGNILGLDAHTKKIFTTAGSIEYERLVICAGGHSSSHYPGIEQIFVPCDGPISIQAMMDRLNSLQKGTLAFGFSGNVQEPTAIRAEPLCEFLFGIDTLLRRQKRRNNFELIFFTSCSPPDARWGIKASGNLIREMARRAIQIRLGETINGFSADCIFMDGDTIHADLIVFIPEMIGPQWAQNSGVPLSPNGFICIDDCCRVPGFEGLIYSAGDASYFPKIDWLAKQAHLADLQGQVLAHNLIADLQGTKINKTFRQEFICIVDTLDGGILVFRDRKRNFVLRSRLLHWAKRLFIWQYLFTYRAKSGK